MPSLTESMTEIARRFESLFSGRGSSSAQGGLLSGVLSSAARGDGAGTSASGIVQEVVPSLLTGPLGLVAGLLGSLLGGRKDEPSFVQYAKPEALAVEYDIAPSAVAARQERPDVLSGIEGSTGPVDGARGGAPPIVIQVSAMDAQSFSNRSSDIAAAVKEALSRSHALRDEIWED